MNLQFTINPIKKKIIPNTQYMQNIQNMQNNTQTSTNSAETIMNTISLQGSMFGRLKNAKPCNCGK